MRDTAVRDAAEAADADPAVEAYARAIVETARAEGALPRVEEELFRFARAVEENSELRERLGDARIGIGLRLEMLSELLQRAHPATVAAATYLVQAGRARQLGPIARAVGAIGAASRSEAVAEVRSAVALDDGQRERLAEAVSQAVGHRVTVRTIVDPAVVGGLVVTVGDTVIDGSVARRLADLRTALVGT